MHGRGQGGKAGEDGGLGGGQGAHGLCGVGGEAAVWEMRRQPGSCGAVPQVGDEPAQGLAGLRTFGIVRPGQGGAGNESGKLQLSRVLRGHETAIAAGQVGGHGGQPGPGQGMVRGGHGLAGCDLGGGQRFQEVQGAGRILHHAAGQAPLGASGDGEVGAVALKGEAEGVQRIGHGGGFPVRLRLWRGNGAGAARGLRAADRMRRRCGTSQGNLSVDGAARNRAWDGYGRPHGHGAGIDGTRGGRRGGVWRRREGAMTR